MARTTSVPEVKQLRDKAEAVLGYLRQQHGGLEVMVQAAALKIRAERKLGELLEPIKAHRPRKLSSISTVLPDGITRDQSSRWQRIAAIPKKIFDAKLAQAEADLYEITTAYFLRLAKEVVVREPRRQRNRDLVENSDPAEHIMEGLSWNFQTIVVDPPWDWGDEGDVDQMGRAGVKLV
jgi:hypothetical protein